MSKFAATDVVRGQRDSKPFTLLIVLERPFNVETGVEQGWGLKLVWYCVQNSGDV